METESNEFESPVGNSPAAATCGDQKNMTSAGPGERVPERFKSRFVYTLADVRPVRPPPLPAPQIGFPDLETAFNLYWRYLTGFLIAPTVFAFTARFFPTLVEWSALPILAGFICAKLPYARKQVAFSWILVMFGTWIAGWLLAALTLGSFLVIRGIFAGPPTP